MVHRFGFGEYERKDVEVPNSTWEMRHQFLSVVSNHKREILMDLARPLNVELLDFPDIGERWKNRFYFLTIAFTFGKWKPIGGVRPELLETPLQHFVHFLARNKASIKRAEVAARKQMRQVREHNILAEAIRQFMPSWKALSTKKSATALCSSIEAWATSKNLNEEWILDFALIFLRNTKVFLELFMKQLSDIPPNADEQTLLKNEWVFDTLYDEARRETILEHHSESVIANLWKTHEVEEIPSFEFIYGHFVMKSMTWFPHLSTRTEFKEDVLRRFNLASQAIKDLDQHGEINEKSFRDSLSAYCDKIEETMHNGGSEEAIQAHSTEHADELYLYSDTWRPTICDRATFIDNYLVHVTQAFNTFKKMAQSLNTKTKERLELAIFSYCNSVQKLMPENYDKTPKSYTYDKHFIWLADFQTPPFLGYAEIAARYSRPDNTINASGVRKAVTRLASQIGLAPRTPPHTGRPKGVVESNRRHRIAK